jgi:hypothetical protein
MTTEDEIVTLFQRRRAYVNTRGWPIAGLGFACLVYAMSTATKPDVSSRVAMGFFIVGIIAFAVGCVVVGTMRCPMCNEVPMGRRGVLVNPTSCSKCGVRLK